jgi:DnaJ-class molecular chaperone
MVNQEILNLLFVFKSKQKSNISFFILLPFSRHSHFERKQNDLYTNLTITLQDALNGFDISFRHLDGHNVRYHLLNLSHFLFFH